jgi:hypothetical protein
MKLSAQLKRDHESGDFGNALEGYAERAALLEKGSYVPGQPCPTCGHKERHKAACPYCGSKKVIAFDADNDICQDCNKWFPGS